ncbi:MAG: RcnB family protein [Caulobacteraceae bacterium]
MTRGGPMVRGGGERGSFARGGRFGHGGGVYARGGRPMRSGGRYYTFHGRRYGSFRAERFHWRHGWGYRSYGVGYTFPFAQWPSEYFISDYAYYGLDAPPPGYWWIRNGPDLVLVDSSTGLVSQTVPGAFDEESGPDDQGGPPDADQGGPPDGDQGGPGDEASGYGPPQDSGNGPPQDGGYGPPQDGGPPPPPPAPDCHGFWCGVRATIQNAACASSPNGCPPDADQPPSGDPQG